MGFISEWQVRLHGAEVFLLYKCEHVNLHSLLAL